jgi:hypothetical protein
MEAAVLESCNSDRSLILTGLEMFDRVDGNLVGSRDQMQLFWTELPEFGFLQNHELGNTERRLDDSKLSLHDKVLGQPEEEAQTLLQLAFIEFLSQLLGFEVRKLDAASPLSAYGLDSLSAVSCQYWIHRSRSTKAPFPKHPWLTNDRSVCQCITQQNLRRPIYFSLGQTNLEGDGS